MTTEQKTARRKLSLLELASEMHNVSKACQAMGYSRQQFYEIRRNYSVAPSNTGEAICKPIIIPASVYQKK